MANLPGFQVIPEVFVLGFNTEDDFRKWAYRQSFSDLQDIIAIFEESEMYEYCAVLMEAKEAKLDELLDGIEVFKD